jgi:hypothetical protein
MIPNVAIIHIHNPEMHRQGFKLWIPLFLLWIPVIVLSPLILLALLVLLAACIVGQVSFFLALRTFWDILCGLPGTDLRVSADDTRILVRIL